MSRKGLTLAEALVALALIAVPLIGMMQLSRANTRGARADAERLVEDQLLADVVEILTAESPEVLRRVAGSTGEVDRMLAKRLAVFHRDSRALGARAVSALTGQVRCELVEQVGGHPELTRLTLTRGGRPVRTRIFRVKRRALDEAMHG